MILKGGTRGPNYSGGSPYVYARTVLDQFRMGREACFYRSATPYSNSKHFQFWGMTRTIRRKPYRLTYRKTKLGMVTRVHGRIVEPVYSASHVSTPLCEAVLLLSTIMSPRWAVHAEYMTCSFVSTSTRGPWNVPARVAMFGTVDVLENDSLNCGSTEHPQKRK